LKLVQERVGNTLEFLGIGNNFLNRTQKAQQLKERLTNGTTCHGNLIHCWWECKLVQQLWKAVWRLLIKLKTELAYDSAKSAITSRDIPKAI
jgi:hypothetical protein